MTDPSSAADAARVAIQRTTDRRRWLLLVVATGIAFVFFPHVWQRGFSAWLAWQRVSLNWGAQGFLAVAAVATLMEWFTRGRTPVRRLGWVAAASLAIWLAINVFVWHWRASVLAPGPWLLVCTSASSVWLLWLWGMFLVPWSWRRRMLVLGGLLLMVPALMFGVDSHGLDGQGAVTLHWRKRGSSPRVVDAPQILKDEMQTEVEIVVSDEDYPMFRGRDRVATIEQPVMSADWSATPPRELWRRPVGAGWGAFAVAGRHALTQEQREDEECIVCYDAGTGRELWIHHKATHFPNSSQEASNMGGEGPRATPTITGDTVLAMGATGWLSCVDRRDGGEQWSVNVLVDNDAPILVHGMAGSPLVVDELVVVSAGGDAGRSLVAYERATGRRVWRAGSDAAGYASPQLIEIAGVPQILIHNAPGISAHAVEDGRVLWTHAWTNGQSVNCSQPVPLGGDNRRLLLTSGYGKGCTLIEVTPPETMEGMWSTLEIWTSRGLKTKFSSAVLCDGCAFGFDDSILCCVDLADGRVRWKRGRYGHGQLMRVGEMLLVQAETGGVMLVTADRDEHRELARLDAMDGKTWNNPAVAGRWLLVRNSSEAVCYELPAPTVTLSLDQAEHEDGRPVQSLGRN